MVHPLLRRRWLLLTGIATAAAGGAAAVVKGIVACDICQAATELRLGGTVFTQCSIAVTATPQAANLSITLQGAQRIMIGSVLQSCNKKQSYIVSVISANCTQAPTGGKLVNAEGSEYLAYSAEFNNPTTGGSQPVVTGLLASSCSGQIGRQVTHAKVNGETSTIYLHLSGDPSLGAGTYQDVVTIALNMQ